LYNIKNEAKSKNKEKQKKNKEKRTALREWENGDMSFKQIG